MELQGRRFIFFSIDMVILIIINGYGQHFNTGVKETISKKIVATIESVLNRKVGPSSIKWSNEEVNNNQEHQVLWGKTNSTLEENESKCSNTSGELNSLKEQDIHQESGSENILDIVNKKSLKSPMRQPITRNNDFLCTNITKS